MKFNPIPLITLCLLVNFSSLAQDESRYMLQLQGGSFIPSKNITPEKINSIQPRSAGGLSFLVLQFEQIPTQAERKQLSQAGIELLDYIPNYAYTATVTSSVDISVLQRVNARAIVDLAPVQKMQAGLATGNFPAHAIKVSGKVDVWISFPKTVSIEKAIQLLQAKNFEINNSDYKNYRILGLRVSINRLDELASMPIVEYVQAVPKEDQALNTNSMAASRANIVRAPLAYGGYNLNGQGVVVGIGDDGDVQSHLDIAGHLVNRAGNSIKAHASHVAGTVAGAGLIKELYTGYAPKATIVSQVFSGIFNNAPAYVQDYGMVITNNSFGTVTNDCFYNGLYDLTSRILDQQAIDLPELQQVFAAGNDGGRTCTPNPAGFRTVLGGYQSAKNVLTVGSTDYKSDVSSFSSRGPVRDGRLKPEIMSQGQFVASTWVNNIYSYNNGTSMAAPGVSGGLALLIQRYRQLHGGTNPKSGLMKALFCNGASDKGNTGPDFRYGLGRMDLLRSITMMNNTSYFNSSVANTVTNTHTITVPANTAQLKVLVYWQDPPASVMATKTLVNDIDLEVVDPSSVVTLPAILDTAYSNVNNPATQGADHVNNIEQVVINNPATGNYDIRIKGTAITQNPSQEYFLVYDVIPAGLVLTNPVGGEAMVPSVSALDTVYIQWDSYGGTSNDFTLEFSSDNGTNWTTLSNTIPAANRIYNWGVPNIPTEQARVRITKNSTGLTQTSFPFTILTVSTVSLDAVQCEGYIKINWTSVPGATDYEVMMLQGDDMVSVTTTTSLSHTFSGLSKDSLYWVTVRPRINGSPGRRADAVSRQPNNGTCAGTISDNDLKIDAVVSPASSGRIFTSTTLSSATAVTIRIKNLDDVVSAGNIDVSYSINGGAPVNATITSPLADIAAGSTIDYTFVTTADLSTAGIYSIQVIATKASDPVVTNNSYTKIFKQLDNQPINAPQLPWLDNLESASVQTITTGQMGFNGLDRYDFVNGTVYGQARTFINTGIAYSGSKAITLDQNRYISGGNVDSLTATFNLATFNTATDDIRIDFRYKNHGQKANAADKVWIRGSDTDPWVEVYDLFANQNPADGSYKLAGSIEVSDSLAAHSQSFSTSFQVRWGQWGEYIAADNESAAGYTFDDIRIYRAVDDIQMISIDTPYTVACGLNTTVPVKITVRNTSNAAVNNIPVVLKVDGTVIATETIAAIPGSSSLQYTFTATANLSSAGNHLIETWVNFVTDNYRENDTARTVINNLPFITTFPYLQNFEAGDGSWYTGGTRSSWEYGTPMSAKIKRAASGTKAWKTNMTGYYNDAELSYLYSPCFNLSGMTTPTLSLSIAIDIEDCGVTLCDAAWVEYSTDGGAVWTKLGAMGQGTNWYNKDYAGNQLWSQQNYTRWHVATTALPAVNNSMLRLRFVFNSDEGVIKDGIAIDDIHIYDNIYGIYTGPTMGAPVMQSIPGGVNSWIDFTTGGKLVASVHPNNQDMGDTYAQAYIHTGAVRTSDGQYYHNRNITIKPDPSLVNLADSATVRFYFLDNETEALIAATGCGSCTKPSMAYELGVSKYSDPNDAVEDGSLGNSLGNYWSFINATNAVKVPFDQGYYAEFKVKNFSEFWLNNGGFDNNHPLPVQLISFSANKTTDRKNVMLNWKTASEFNVSHFEIELAKSNDDFRLNRFVKIGEVNSNGNSTIDQQYGFMDAENNKLGVRYYRLKIVDNDGSFSYSAVRSVVFTNEITWQVFPNPSSDVFNLVYQVNEGEVMTIKVYDAGGKTVYQSVVTGTGFIQKMSINMGASVYASGLYLLEAGTREKKQSFRLVKK